MVTFSTSFFGTHKLTDLLKKKFHINLLLRKVSGLVLMLLIGGDAVAGLQAPPLRGSLGAHDPSSIIKCKDKYYLFYTGQNISWKSSTD